MDGSTCDATALPEGLQLSELDAEYRDCPHMRLDRLRELAPRYIDPPSRGSRLFLTRHADVRAAMADRTLTRDAARTPSRGSPASDTLLLKEGDEHLTARKLVARALEARVTKRRREEIAKVVSNLLDRLAERGEFDGIADFAAPIPITVVADVLGLPRADIGQFRAWAVDSAVLALMPKRTDDENRRLVTAVSELRDYIAAAVKTKRASPGDDLMSELIAANINGQPVPDEEIAPLCYLVLVAGSITTTDLLGNAIALLLRHPDQTAQLRANPPFIESAIEEVLRIDPPVSAVGRHIGEDRTFMGCPMRAGGTVKSSLLAANHDAEAFDDPHTFNIERTDNKHVSFGGGAHGCLGANLARLEAQIAIQMLFERFPGLRFAGEPKRKITYGFRGFETLPLRTS